MSAVGGSPTQVSTSASTAAVLAGTPDDAFKDGDLAWVDSLGRHFVLRRGTAPYVANNTTLIDTFSGNGCWQIQGAPGEFWGGVGDWYIDAVNGLNTNPGNTQAEPLATFGELRKRFVGATQAIAANVWVLSDIPSSDVPVFEDLPVGSVIRVEGDLGTVSAVGGTITGGIAGYAGGSMAANQHFEMNTSVAAAGLVGKLLKLVTGEICYGVKAVAANTLRTTPFINPSTYAIVTPVLNSVFTIETPPVLAAHPIVTGNDDQQSVLFRQVWFENTGLNLPVGTGFGSTTTFVGCRFTDGFWAFVSGYAAVTGCLLYAGNPVVVQFNVWNACELTLSKSCVLSTFGYLYLYSGARLVVSDRTLMQTGSTVLGKSGASVRVSNLAVCDASYKTFDLEELCTLQIYNATGAFVYGTLNAEQIFSLGANVKATYAVLADLVSTGAGDPIIFKGYASQAWAALPTVKTAAAADTQATFVLAP